MANALAFNKTWRNWNWLGGVADALYKALPDCHSCGLVARNRPAHIAAFAHGLLNRRTTVMIYASQSPQGIAQDIEALRLPAIIADHEDWNPTTLAAAERAGSVAIAIKDHTLPTETVTLLQPGHRNHKRDPAPEIAFELLSSGTTGPPKRIPMSWSTLEAIVADAQVSYSGTDNLTVPQVMVHPLGNIAGIAYVAPPLVYKQPLVLLEKFHPETWADAVQQYQPSRGTVPPAGIQMLLESAVTADQLQSLKLIAVGGGKLDPSRQQAFEDRFNIPLLTAFGATEFGGVVANWSLDLYQQWGKEKRGSAGRAAAGVALRIVDENTHAVLPPNSVGLLEARVPRIGGHWIRTTDLATLDDDGFLFHCGRADNAINRGGFKIVPDAIADVIRQHPDVADAAVVGVPDSRLGEVPFAAVELAANKSLTSEALTAWLRDRVLSYQVPAAILMVDSLPRNASMKISLSEIKALFP